MPKLQKHKTMIISNLTNAIDKNCNKLTKIFEVKVYLQAFFFE